MIYNFKLSSSVKLSEINLIVYVHIYRCIPQQLLRFYIIIILSMRIVGFKKIEPVELESQYFLAFEDKCSYSI